jgi:hypothetical protein
MKTAMAGSVVLFTILFLVILAHRTTAIFSGPKLRTRPIITTHRAKVALRGPAGFSVRVLSLSVFQDGVEIGGVGSVNFADINIRKNTDDWFELVWGPPSFLKIEVRGALRTIVADPDVLGILESAFADWQKNAH